MSYRIVSDDRTGGLETAAVLADRGAGSVPVWVWDASASPPAEQARAMVWDLASRHLPESEAADRARSVPNEGMCGHKVDSALRGNWAVELAARHHESDRPVLLVPALPQLGRWCVDGVVCEHGRPIHTGGGMSDVQRRLVSSRPADFLRQAGVSEVHELSWQSDRGEAWLASPSGIAVVDATDQDEIDEIVTAWTEHPEPILAGPSAIHASVASALGEPLATPALQPVDGPILMVCGSVHPATQAQLLVAEHEGVPVAAIADEITAQVLAQTGEMVLTIDIPVGDVTEPMAVAAAASLAGGATELVRSVPIGALILIGGDTATAILGDDPAVVYRSVDAGTAWLSTPRFDVPILARSGAFGSEHSLVGLMRSTLRQEWTEG